MRFVFQKIINKGNELSDVELKLGAIKETSKQKQKQKEKRDRQIKIPRKRNWKKKTIKSGEKENPQEREMKKLNRRVFELLFYNFNKLF